MSISNLTTAHPEVITTCHHSPQHQNGRECSFTCDTGETYSTNTLELAVTITTS